MSTFLRGFTTNAQHIHTLDIFQVLITKRDIDSMRSFDVTTSTQIVIIVCVHAKKKQPNISTNSLENDEKCFFPWNCIEIDRAEN